jgi:hypothetical protein
VHLTSKNTDAPIYWNSSNVKDEVNINHNNLCLAWSGLLQIKRIKFELGPMMGASERKSKKTDGGFLQVRVQYTVYDSGIMFVLAAVTLKLTWSLFGAKSRSAGVPI